MAEQQPAKSKRRVVKNPETFRERAVKASDNNDKPKRSAKLKQAVGKRLRPVFAPLKRAGGKVRRLKALRPVFKVLRFIGRILLPKYFRDSWSELRQVAWPNWRESRRLTSAVLIFAVIFGATIALVDYGLDKVFRDVLLK